MTTQHTPGPWHVIADPAWKGKHPLHDARFVATCDESYSSIICTMPDSENQKANARLIAAAPELLDFAKLVARSACLKQENGDKCICFSCEARRLIERVEGK